MVSTTGPSRQRYHLVQYQLLLWWVVIILSTIVLFTATANAQNPPSSSSSSSSSVSLDVCIADSDCRNGGSCQSSIMLGRKHCHCRTGFSGPKCTRYCPLSCQHGGVCMHVRRDPSSSTLLAHGKSFVEESIELDQEHYFEYDALQYVCKCKGYWTGNLCQVPYVNCGGGKDRRCFHGGTCVYHEEDNTIAGCDCLEGYGGDFCEEKIIVETAQEESETALEVPKREMIKEGKIILISLLIVLAAGTSVAIYVKKVANVRILHHVQTIFTMPRKRISLPQVVQDPSTDKMVCYRDRNEEDGDEDDDDGDNDNISCCSGSPTHSLT